ncbi:MAG TPA: SRPBCC family protein [Reyranella sp.]|nr:SRPBCC family protein [Reyranella sp.]
MPSVTETTIIPSPADRVWPLLRDPALVASCIPGATLSPDQGDGLWHGSIRVKFGPTVAVFRGEARLAFDDAARTCTIEGRGIDGRGASRALASGLVKVSGSDTTELAVDGTFSVSGPLETFANAGGIHVARALLAEFSANMAKKLAAQSLAVSPVEAAPLAAPPTSTAPSPPSAPPQAAEIGGFGLLWRAFLSWLRGMSSR